jgi:hypothetical protein
MTTKIKLFPQYEYDDTVLERIMKEFDLNETDDLDEIESICSLLDFHWPEPSAAAERIGTLLNTDPDRVYKLL